MKRFIVSILIVLGLTIQSHAAILVFSPDGIVTTQTDLATAATAKNTAGKKVVVSSAITLPSDLTWPSDRVLVIEKGGLLTIPRGKTMTINGPFSDPGSHQVFAGAGSVVFSTLSTPFVRPEWWNCAAGNSVTTNSAALSKVISAAKANGNIVQFSTGTYNLNTHVPIRQDESITPVTTVISFNNIVLQGRGKGTILKTNNAAYGADVFQFRGVSDITVRDLAVASDIPVGALDGSNGFSFTDGSYNITVENVHAYTLPYTHTPGPNDLNGGAAYSIQDNSNTLGMHDIRIINCTADGGTYGIAYLSSGKAASGSNPIAGVVFRGNVLRNFYRGITIQTNFGGRAESALPTQQFSVTGNKVIDCQVGFDFGGSSGINATGNEILSSLTSAVDPATGKAWKRSDTTLRGVIALSLFRSNISNNVIYSASSTNFMIIGGGFSAHPNTPMESCTISSNTLSGVATGSGVRLSEAYGGIINSNVSGNTVTGYTGRAFDNGILKISESNPGEELLTGGNFSSSSGWTITNANWTISGGVAKASGVLGNQSIFRNIHLIARRKYELSVDVSSYSGSGTGGFYVYEEGGRDTLLMTQFVANEKYTRVITPIVTGSYRIGIFGLSKYHATHDNLSIKEVPMVE